MLGQQRQDVERIISGRRSNNVRTSIQQRKDVDLKRSGDAM